MSYVIAFLEGIITFQTMCFIDARGYAIAQAAGAIDADPLQRGIDRIGERK